MVFLRMATQWKRNPMNNQREGLDYTGLDKIFKLCGVTQEENEATLDKFQLLEVLSIKHQPKPKG